MKTALHPGTGWIAKEKPVRPRFVLGPALALARRLWLRGAAALAEGRAGGRARCLRVVETVPLGEKRFVAIVEAEGERFLIGGGASGVSLLTSLKGQPEFASVLARQQEDKELGA
jgi:hypothetical protein